MLGRLEAACITGVHVKEIQQQIQQATRQQPASGVDEGMIARIRVSTIAGALALVMSLSSAARAQQAAGTGAPAPDDSPAPQSTSNPDVVFDMGKIEVVGSIEGRPAVGGALLTSEQIWVFDRKSLDQAVNVVPGVVSSVDANGRRNESDVFVRGFGRWQVPLMVDGVRIYLPADNRIDFARFLTADIAEVQIQKGYASVLDGPGAMGGVINLVTRRPAKAFEAEGSLWTGGRGDTEGWNGYVMVGSRQPKFYVQGSANYSDRDFWTLSGNYPPTGNSLQPSGRRQSSDTSDSRFNVKAGWTPNDTDEYTVNYIRQLGEKGAPLNVLNNPPVPPNTFWRWPYWDVQNTSFLSRTQLGAAAHVKTKVYYNTFSNGLDAFDDGTYTTQSLNGRFHSPYGDHAYGVGIEVGRNRWKSNTVKGAFHYRTDVHTEQQTSRPTHPTLATTEPLQEQSQYTWSLAVEDTVHLRPNVDLVGGISVDRYAITKAEEFNATRGAFEYPRGGSDAFNWQTALIWRYSQAAEVHASVSNRSRFPVIFELYSTRFGTATPNPDLGAERATNVEIGWKGTPVSRLRLEGTFFYSDVRDLIQTVLLADNTTQTQNVGDGRFYGAEFAVDAQVSRQLSMGANYTSLSREIVDALLPTLRPTGVPTHKAFLYAAWRPVAPLTITPSLDLAGDRWSDINTNPVPAFPYVRTGAYTLLNLAAEYSIARNFDVVFGFKNLTDDNFALAWGFPQPGRTYYVKTRVGL
jgi:iron complex outermembrane receptor protein